MIIDEMIDEARRHAKGLGLNAIERTIGDAQGEIMDLRDILRRNGFVPCDSPICNCGSWHQRHGLVERVEEWKEILANAGHPLCNENGHLFARALQELVSERDALIARLRK